MAIDVYTGSFPGSEPKKGFLDRAHEKVKGALSTLQRSFNTASARVSKIISRISLSPPQAPTPPESKPPQRLEDLLNNGPSTPQEQSRLKSSPYGKRLAAVKKYILERPGAKPISCDAEQFLEMLEILTKKLSEQVRCNKDAAIILAKDGRIGYSTLSNQDNVVVPESFKEQSLIDNALVEVIGATITSTSCLSPANVQQVWDALYQLAGSRDFKHLLPGLIIKRVVDGRVRQNDEDGLIGEDSFCLHISKDVDFKPFDLETHEGWKKDYERAGFRQYVLNHRAARAMPLSCSVEDAYTGFKDILNEMRQRLDRNPGSTLVVADNGYTTYRRPGIEDSHQNAPNLRESVTSTKDSYVKKEILNWVLHLVPKAPHLLPGLEAMPEQQTYIDAKGIPGREIVQTPFISFKKVQQESDLVAGWRKDHEDFEAEHAVLKCRRFLYPPKKVN